MTNQQTSSPPAELGVALDGGRLRATPVILASGEHRCAGFYHPPAGDDVGAATLICSPWGWDEVSSYRPRRRLAEYLASQGHPTLRFDLPGTGDSTGDAREPGTVETWLGSIEAAIEWLRDLGAPRVGVIGLGLGGLLARETVRRGAPVDDLVVWGAPADGRRFVREGEAFARLQTSRGDDPGDLPEGWREIGGYLISAETAADLKALPPGLPPNPTLTRALLMGRDGVAADESLATSLRRIGVAVTTDPGSGWSGVISHPESSEMPAKTAARIVDWLDEAPSDTATHLSSPDERPQLSLPDGVVETPFAVHENFGELYGVLAMPPEPRDDGLCALLLNAGAIQHSGPNRLWVEASRRWAAAGVPTLRLDLEGIGEADGSEWRNQATADFYAPKFVDQVVATLDVLEAEGIGDRFLCAGLCTGAYWSARAALADERVEAVVMMNGGALSWHEGLADNRASHRFDRVFSFDWWRRLVLGGIRRPSASEFGAVVRARLRSLKRRIAARFSGRGDGGGPLISDLDLLQAKGVRLVLAFSGGEALDGELAGAGVWDRLAEWPNVKRLPLPGNDHTLRSLPAQQAAAEILDAEMRHAVSAAGPQSP